MRICTDHWAQIRGALADHALIAVVKKNGIAAEDPAPFANMNFSIFNAFIGTAEKVELMGDACPLCQVGKVAPGLDGGWIAGAVEIERSRSAALVR